jgi:hypothetical protein
MANREITGPKSPTDQGTAQTTAPKAQLNRVSILRSVTPSNSGNGESDC